MYQPCDVVPRYAQCRGDIGMAVMYHEQGGYLLYSGTWRRWSIFILGSFIYRWGIMCISKLVFDWWKLVGMRRLNSGYFLVWTYWMRIFMLCHELSLDSSVIIQYLFYRLSLSWVHTTPSRASCVYTFGDLSTVYHGICYICFDAWCITCYWGFRAMFAGGVRFHTAVVFWYNCSSCSCLCHIYSSEASF